MQNTSSHAAFDRDPLVLLHDVARIMRTRFDAWARMRGLTRAQAIILSRLSRQSGLSQNEMAAICEVEPITVGRLIDRLEARGLVERRADPSDRRIRRLHLLPAAERITAEIDYYRQQLNAELATLMPKQTQEALIDALSVIKNHITTDDATMTFASAGE
jgi:DNA-binding MarR family transcriptional regulator